MEDSFSVAELAAVLSLSAASSGGDLRLSRHGRSVVVPSSVTGHFEPSTPLGRHLAYGVLFGVRLAIDRVVAQFDVADERPQKPDQVFLPHQMPSIYGERLPRMVTRPTMAWFAALTGAQPVTTDWIIEGLGFVYVLETGKHLHVLADSDLERMDLTRQKIVDDARHALFYDSYKLKPRDKERTDDGLVRIFKTVEGLGASRAMLLPDYDYDAAREHGCFAIPSRDTMIIGRPSDKARAEAVSRRVTELTAQLVDAEAFPLSSMVYPMTSNAALAGDYAGATHLPPADDVVSAVTPPSGVTIDS